jgi:hypothetical protein
MLALLGNQARELFKRIQPDFAQERRCTKDPFLPPLNDEKCPVTLFGEIQNS